jgi:hypothetical protein
MIMTTVTIGNRCPDNERLEEERFYEVSRSEAKLPDVSRGRRQ